MLTGSPPPIIIPEIKKVLQLFKQTKVGELVPLSEPYRNQNIWLHAFTNKFPRYLPMRLFSLEYYRQIINVDEVNLVNAKNKAYFKIKDQLGPFICNSRETGKEEYLILQRMMFQRRFVWRCDPLEFITKKRQKVKLGPFIKHPIPEIEAYANQTEWVEGTLVGQDNNMVDIENTLIDIERQLDEGSFL